MTALVKPMEMPKGGYKDIRIYDDGTWIRLPLDHVKPLTNADSIRAMTDEELAEWGATLPCCPPGPDVRELCFPKANECGGDRTLARKCWLNWLKQEVKG